jgi:hypothetical protein
MGKRAFMRVEEFEGLTKKQLRAKANECFDKIEGAGHEQTPALLLEAQFYLREIDRRHDSWIAWRDLILEAIIIALIAGEVWFGWREGEKQFKVLQNLGASSEATAKTLTALAKTTEEMNTAVHTQLNLNYEVSVGLNYERSNATIHITNNGRAPISVYGYRIEDYRMMLQRPLVITSQGSTNLPNEEFFQKTANQASHPKNKRSPLVVFLRAEDGREYEIIAELFMNWTSRDFEIYITSFKIEERKWSAPRL